MLPELENKLIATAIQVVMGAMQPVQAIESIGSDGELARLPDERLRALIEETDRYWRGHLDVAVSQPGNVAIYPMLMAAAAEPRLKAIGAFRKGIREPERADWDRRMAEWITLFTETLIARGMALLLLGQPQPAWETFTRANLGARALPDFGQLRLREVLFAAYGQRVAAAMGNQPQLAAMASEEYDALQRAPDRGEEARRYVQEVQQEFDRVLGVLKKRSETAATGSS